MPLVSTMPSSPNWLNKLPNELIDQVASYLPYTPYMMLRSTCRRFHTSLPLRKPPKYVNWIKLNDKGIIGKWLSTNQSQTLCAGCYENWPTYVEDHRVWISGIVTDIDAHVGRTPQLVEGEDGSVEIITELGPLTRRQANSRFVCRLCMAMLVDGDASTVSTLSRLCRVYLVGLSTE